MGRSAAREDEPGAMQVVSRVARILRALDREPAGLSLAQLAAGTDLPRSSVHRLVTAMQLEGLVAAAPRTGRTRLGPELARLALSSRQELRRELRPYMEDLHERLAETIGLSVLDHDAVRFVDQITANHPLQAITAVGELLPAYCSASGRALLATRPPQERERAIPARLVAHSPSTNTDRDAVLAELERVAREGIAVTREEYTEGVCAAAVAVRDAYGAVAAISVSIPSPRFARRSEEITAALLAVGRQAAAALGDPTDPTDRGERCDSST
jgi:DNA-binding IclR family transcriptional regulator